MVLSDRLIIGFFLKQKTAYEMRISDWSSDVCSSDLAAAGGRPPAAQTRRRRGGMVPRLSRRLRPGRRRRPGVAVARGGGGTARPGHDRRQIGRASCRARGVHYDVIWIVAVPFKKTQEL